MLDARFTQLRFGTRFNPARVMRYQIWVAWVADLPFNHAHPALELDRQQQFECGQETRHTVSPDLRIWTLSSYHHHFSHRLISGRRRVLCTPTGTRINFPSRSRNSGSSPVSAPAIFFRIVVFPAFRLPTIKTRKTRECVLNSSAEISIVVSP